MILEQFYLACLSQASYLVGDETTGRAVVVDPRRDVDVYRDFARDHGLVIEATLLTHVHADFVPGWAELGVPVLMSAAAEVGFPFTGLPHGERVTLGGTSIECLATPGHTPESVTFAVYADRGRTPAALLTGDTLFLGDVGRPDLLAAAGRTAADMARDLHTSLGVFADLPGDVLVYPGHGAGSACGKALSDATVSTLAEQRRDNYALAPMSADAFVAALTDGLAPPPSYFARTAALNRAGHAPFAAAEPPVLTPGEVAVLVSEGCLLLDVRDAGEYAPAHLTGAVNVALAASRFAEFAAAVHAPGQPVVLVGAPIQTAEARVRLARVGIDDVRGTAAPGGPAVMTRVDAAEALRRIEADPELQVVDVRQPGEHACGALPRALLIPLPQFRDRIAELDPARPVLVHCAAGIRSAAAASLLIARGFTDVVDLVGGFAAVEALAA